MSGSDKAKEYVQSSRNILSTILVPTSSIAWERAIYSFELYSKAIEADPSLAEAYLGRAGCSQLFMTMIVGGSELIKEYAQKHISLDKENTLIQDLIKAEKLGSYEAKNLLENDPDISRLRAIYNQRSSSSKTSTSVATNSQQGDCFIATAAYSSTEHPDINTFRDFRDSVLLTNFIGRFLVAYYYQIGPILAKYVKKNKSIQLICRKSLSKIARLIRQE
ncbi:MAG: CFI-box-CTERM domain-containing protein [Nostoc sp.]|uniref:CFI-box-CTERM domain-containing protein n=1 Tax=Nostoc sp. TaxID=1180 RepID=UPI002FFAE978